MIIEKEILHGHLFCGIGAGAQGFNDAQPRVGNTVAKYRCVGGIDVDPRAIADFKRFTGVPGTLMDLFDLEQYLAFHGHMPPPGWCEMMPADIHRAFNYERPNTIFLSAPCKGFSGLLSQTKSLTDKYQALNRLTLRGVWLMLEAYKDDPVEMILFENVPRIATRGRHLLDQITGLLRSYGYAVAETTHDCGEIGGLAQSRKRFLLVARHIEKVPPFLYEPVKKPLRAVGDVLSRMPMAGDPLGGPMHRIPALQWKTWVRLAFVEAGSDWRSLNKLAVEDGNLRDFLIVPEMRGGLLGVNQWDAPTGTVTSRGLPTNGNFSVADPRGYGDETMKNVFRVTPWDGAAGVVSAGHSPSNGGGAVADPRMEIKHNNCFRIVKFDQTTGTVTGGTGPSAGGQGVADPRTGWDRHSNNLSVMSWERNSNAVIAGGKGVQGGYMSVADPLPNMARGKGDHYLTGGHYGVVGWDQTSYAVAAAANLDNGHWSVADPRQMPAADEKIVCRIISLDNTHHRPFTTLELAALQSLFDPDDWFHPDSEYFTLEGASDQRWREGIGNAVPSATARAIAECIGTTLLLAWNGETFALSSMPIWVQPVAVGLSVAQGEST